MYDSITDSIRRHGFKRLLLAVSGGLDSICLAHYFICNKTTLGIEWLGIAHVHHGLRVGTADRDAAFVEAFARKYNVPFFLKKLDGEALKSAEGSLEENARDARYKALIEIAEKNVTLEAPSAYTTLGTKSLSGSYPLCGDRVHGSYRSRSSLQDDISNSELRTPNSEFVIVTAHHAGDQAETMYMRLRRGTTLAGLRGIQEVRVLSNSQGVAGLASEAPLEGVMEDRATGCNQGETSPTQDDKSFVFRLSSFVFLYRPFLSVTRQKLLAYARENNLEWEEDESNADVNFARNRIRHEMLPRLEHECPGAAAQLCRIAALADRAYGKVMEVCAGMFGTCLRVDDIPRASITLDKKKLRKVLLAHKNTDLSEMFRLWLSEKGLRFPIGFFYGPKEPACVKIPHHAVYRRRAIVKIGQSVQICEFGSPEEAENFVSCGKKNKGL